MVIANNIEKKIITFSYIKNNLETLETAVNKIKNLII